jgi:hypothetical protein
MQTQQQALQQLQQIRTTNKSSIFVDAVREVQSISASMDVLTSLLNEQADKVGFVEDAADIANEHIRGGNKELAQSASRPNFIRDAMVFLILTLAIALIFLDN